MPSLTAYRIEARHGETERRMTAPAPRTMVESEKGAVLARYKLRAMKNDHRAKDFHRTGAPARQKRGGGGRNPPHGAFSAPKEPRILAREPESTARSLFRARISPRSPHKGHSAPRTRRSRSTEPFPHQNPPKPPHGPSFAPETHQELSGSATRKAYASLP